MKTPKLSVLVAGLILLLVSTFGWVDQTFSQEEFIRGDADGDCYVSYYDVAQIMGYFFGGLALPCMDAGDVDDDGIVNVADMVYLLYYLFQSGSPPPPPFPTPGTDPTPDDLDCLAECVAPDPTILDSLIVSDVSGAGGETEVVIPIIAVNTQDLFGYQIFLDYDEDILEVTAVETTGTATGGADFFDYELNVTQGEVEIVSMIDYSGVTSIPAGTNELVKIIFSVKLDVPAGITILDLNDVAGVPFKGNLFTYAGGRISPTLVDGNFTVVQVDFIRGDADGDCQVSYYDAAHLTGHLYGSLELPCMDAGDVDDNGVVNLGDVTYLINYLFKSGPPPPAPFPTPGTDPTPDDLGCVDECVSPEPSILDSLIAADASGSCGETEVGVPIIAVNSQDLFGYQIFLDYDEDISEVTAVETTGTATGGADFFDYVMDVDQGEVEIVSLVDISGVASIPAGTNELVKIIFLVQPDAPVGTTILDLNNIGGVPFIGNLFTYDEGKIYPTLVDGDFAVEPNPSIIFITDVGNDQGRQVRVNWSRSCYDLEGSPVTITEYSIWRRIDADKANSESQEILSSNLGILDMGRIYPPGDWDFIKTIPARGEEEYNTVCPTLGDSTQDGGMYWSVFFVSAMTADPLVYFDSDPDSGYSLDNIPPLPIQDLEIDPNSWFTLQWTVPGEYPEEQPIASYDIRYSPDPVGADTQAWWDNAETCAGEAFFNFIVGEEDSFKVAKESWCHPECYFAIKGLDSRPNASEISNITHFVCGDDNGDGVVNLGDIVHEISYVFRQGPPPQPGAAGDVNCDGIENLGDIVYKISYVFRGGPPPCSQ